MPTIQLHDIPEDIHAELKQRAQRDHRSLSQEADRRTSDELYADTVGLRRNVHLLIGLSAVPE